MTALAGGFGTFTVANRRPALVTNRPSTAAPTLSCTVRYVKHNYPHTTPPESMADILSASERDRIIRFVNTPRYERTPEQLLPDGAENERTDEGASGAE